MRSNCQADAQRQPWFQIKEDKAAATTVYVILRVVDNLKAILAPILPHTPVLRTRLCYAHAWATHAPGLRTRLCYARACATHTPGLRTRLCYAHACATHRAQKLHEYLGYDGQPFGSAQGRLFGTQRVVECEEEARHGGVRSHQALTYDHAGAVGTWTVSELPPGQALRQPAPLFRKLDESMMEEEYARLEG